MGAHAVFHIIMIRPTRYGQDGYPLQWRKLLFPSCSLACIYALAEDARQRRILGPRVDLQLHAIDEANQRISHSKLIGMIEKSGGRGMVMMVGVQTNQFFRAVDLAHPFVDQGIPVIIGGFHVSGVLATLDGPSQELQSAIDAGIHLFAGEAEERRLDEVIRDAYTGKLKNIYNYIGQFPSLKGAPAPFLPVAGGADTINWYTTFDLGRGCPNGCSFCTVINVNGRKSRYRSADDLEAIVRKNRLRKAQSYFITDDNFARNRNWQALLDRLILLRKAEGIDLRLTIQTDMSSYKIPGFIERCVRAGVDQVFIGLESINPKSLAEVNKTHNRIQDYRRSLLAWKRYPVVIYAGYIIGFRNENRESVLSDIETIKRELPVDILHFTILTPLPGSQDHKDMVASKDWMDPDLNKYALCNRVTRHPELSVKQWEDLYQEVYTRYYTKDHVKTILRRMVALGSNKKLTTIKSILIYSNGYRTYGIHPLEVGYRRVRHRRDRRPGMKRENPLVFYPKYFIANLWDTTCFYFKSMQLYRTMMSIWKHPKRFEYSDMAIAETVQK